MYLLELLDALRVFEDAHRGRQALRDTKIKVLINGEDHPSYKVFLKIGGSFGVINDGTRFRISGYDKNCALLELWLIRFGRPEEVTWGMLWDSIGRAWSEAGIGYRERKKASKVIAVSAAVFLDRDVCSDYVSLTHEPLRPLEGVELRMGGGVHRAARELRAHR